MNTQEARAAAGRSARNRKAGAPVAALLVAGVAGAWALLGCSSDPAPPAPPGPPPRACVPGETLFTYRLPFQLEYRNAGEATFSACFDDLEGAVVLTEDYRFLRAGRAYPAAGKRRDLPESNHVLYALSFRVPDVDPAVCPEGSASVSMTFSARQGWREFAGGFAAYCGPEPAGRAFQVLRVSGVLERTD